MNPLDFATQGCKLLPDGLFHHRTHLVIADVVFFLMKALLNVLTVELACTETGNQAYLTALCFKFFRFIKLFAFDLCSLFGRCVSHEDVVFKGYSVFVDHSGGIQIGVSGRGEGVEKSHALTVTCNHFFSLLLLLLLEVGFLADQVGLDGIPLKLVYCYKLGLSLRFPQLRGLQLM